MRCSTWGGFQVFTPKTSDFHEAARIVDRKKSLRYENNTDCGFDKTV